MIAVIDYGMGNLRSVAKAVQKVGGDAQIVHSLEDVRLAEKIILPGVGAFADAIERLRRTGLDEAILGAVDSGTPLLGICLGYQMLFNISFEDGEHTGLGLLGGRVMQFQFPLDQVAEKLKVPHMGWNAIRFNPNCPLFTGIEQESYVYFVHSYYPEVFDESVVAATARYGYDFPAAVWKNNIYATQFHPEKSQAVGLQMLKNFVNL